MGEKPIHALRVLLTGLSMAARGGVTRMALDSALLPLLQCWDW